MSSNLNAVPVDYVVLALGCFAAFNKHPSRSITCLKRMETRIRHECDVIKGMQQRRELREQEEIKDMRRSALITVMREECRTPHEARGRKTSGKDVENVENVEWYRKCPQPNVSYSMTQY